MNVAIINGSIQKNNGSQINAELVRDTFSNDATIVAITAFTELFHGDYIYFDNATADQRIAMEMIRDASAIVFIVPTYFKSIPGGLKNFLDVVREKSLYEHKVIGFMASNHKNQDFGARQTREIVEGIIEFFSTEAVFIPEITISNPEHPDHEAARKLVRDIRHLQAHYQPQPVTI